MRKTISVRGVDEDAIELLGEMRAEERRLAGGLISDAIRCYYDSLYSDDQEAEDADLFRQSSKH